MHSSFKSSENTYATESENERINALWKYEIINSIEIKEFDAITKLAARICGVRISLINLIDAEHQWTKSSYGIDLKEMPRDESICQYTIEADRLIEIENLNGDPRFMDNWYVRHDPNLKFYAGIPLKTPRGYNIGALCVLDTEKNSLSRWQRESLALLSEEVIARLELRLRHRQLEELNEQKDEILHIVSHDLRNPLSGIMGIANLIKIDGVDSEGELKELMEMIEQNACHLLENVNELLDVAFIESGSLELSPALIDIREATEDTVSLHIPTAKVKGVSLESVITIEEDEGMYDEVRYEQILANLITNAIKFTPPEGSVKVEVMYPAASKKHDRQGMKLKVSDTGIGIPEEFIPVLFTKFGKHGRTGTAGEKSTGLGLSLLKGLVDAHEGWVDVQSKENKGTTFTVFLPELSTAG